MINAGKPIIARPLRLSPAPERNKGGCAGFFLSAARRSNAGATLTRPSSSETDR